MQKAGDPGISPDVRQDKNHPNKEASAVLPLEARVPYRNRLSNDLEERDIIGQSRCDKADDFRSK
jgi:hypothetical protein